MPGGLGWINASQDFAHQHYRGIEVLPFQNHRSSGGDNPKDGTLNPKHERQGPSGRSPEPFFLHHWRRALGVFFGIDRSMIAVVVGCKCKIS